MLLPLTVSDMFNELKLYCREIIDFKDQELDLIDHYFKKLELKKKDHLLENGTICNFLAFVVKGSVRFYHILDGDEKTCDILFENAWATDFKSFTTNSPAKMNLQVMENTLLYLISKSDLEKLYLECKTFETFGRLMAEHVANRATDIAMSLSSDKPEQRYLNLLQDQPQLFQRIPQKYISNLIGISPESLSRIRNRIHIKAKS